MNPCFQRSTEITISGSGEKCVAMVTSQCPVLVGEWLYFLTFKVLFTCLTYSHHPSQAAYIAFLNIILITLGDGTLETFTQ